MFIMGDLEASGLKFQMHDIRSWNNLNGGLTVPGTLETILELLPSPIQIEQRDTILIVVEYETWKQMVLWKQFG